MSVKLIDNDAFYGFRVRRTVDGKQYQEYLSLKVAGKKASAAAHKKIEAQANKRDKELAEQQQKAKQKNKATRCFNADGTVKGISFLHKQEKSGSVTPIFQLGMSSELKNRVVCTSYSINAHGLDKAWQKAVDTYCSHKNINKGTKLYKKIKAAMPKVDKTALSKDKPKAKAKAKTAAKPKARAKKAKA